MTAARCPGQWPGQRHNWPPPVSESLPAGLRPTLTETLSESKATLTVTEAQAPSQALRDIVADGGRQPHRGQKKYLFLESNLDSDRDWLIPFEHTGGL